MVTINNLESLRSDLSRRIENTTNIVVGIVFAHPDDFTQKELYNKIKYFHLRSDKYITFYWPGFVPKQNIEHNEYSVKFWGTNWIFDTKKYANFIEQIENISKWSYSGNPELLIFDAINDNNNLILSFENCISIDLLKSIKEKNVLSISELFEEIFKLSRENSGINARGISSKSIFNTINNSLPSVVFSFIPRQLQAMVNNIYTRGTENLEK